jgi:hypothetical protein
MNILEDLIFSSVMVGNVGSQILLRFRHGDVLAEAFPRRVLRQILLGQGDHHGVLGVFLRLLGWTVRRRVRWLAGGLLQLRGWTGRLRPLLGLLRHPGVHPAPAPQLRRRLGGRLRRPAPLLLKQLVLSTRLAKSICQPGYRLQKAYDNPGSVCSLPVMMVKIEIA